MSGEDGSESNGSGAVETDFDTSMESLESEPDDFDNPVGGGGSPDADAETGGEHTGDPDADSNSVAVPRKFLDAKEGRDAVTFYISDDAEEQLTQLRHHLETQFPNEKVRRLDVYAAVIEAGLDGFEGAEAQMREWGYGKDIR